MNLKYVFGIKPTGLPHLGHYKCIKDYDKDTLYVFIADLHALTTTDKVNVEKYTISLIKFFLVLGIKPSNIIIQSKQNSILNEFICLMPLVKINKMKQMHLFKVNNNNLNILEFNYPILMCADLIYLNFCDGVLLGTDQIQHYELAKNLSKKINKKIPDIICVNTIIGLDNRKMSKNYNNIISFCDNNLWKQINKIVTLNVDKVKLENIENNLTTFLTLFETKENIIERYKKGTDFLTEKKILYEFINNIKQRIEETILDKNILNNIFIKKDIRVEKW